MPDDLLTAWVGAVNRAGNAEFAVVLYVSGLIISGCMISRYFELLADLTTFNGEGYQFGGRRACRGGQAGV